MICSCFYPVTLISTIILKKCLNARWIFGMNYSLTKKKRNQQQQQRKMRIKWRNSENQHTQRWWISWLMEVGKWTRKKKKWINSFSMFMQITSIFFFGRMGLFVGVHNIDGFILFSAYCAFWNWDISFLFRSLVVSAISAWSKRTFVD